MLNKRNLLCYTGKKLLLLILAQFFWRERVEKMKLGRWWKILLLLSVFLLLAAPVMAEENKQISIQLNGKPLALTDSTPLLVEGRVFVPFRAVFEGLEAAVSYDAEKKQIAASRGDRNLIMTIGNPTIKLHLNGVDAVVNSDAPSFIHNGRTYVPVRFAAQALDCQVGWDAAREVVIILDKAQLAATTGEYQLIDELQIYNQKIAQKNRALEGNFTLQLADRVNPLKIVKFNLKGVTNSHREDIKISVEPDTMSLAHDLLKEYGTITSQGEKLLQTMEDLELNLRVDKESGEIYLKSEILALLDDKEIDSWYKISGLELTDVLLANQEAKISEIIDVLLKNISLTDSVAAASLLDSIDMLREAYSDEKFVQQDNCYVSEFSDVENGVSLALKTTLAVNNQQIEGYTSEMTITDEKSFCEYLERQGEDFFMLEVDLKNEKIRTKLQGRIEYKDTTEAPAEIPQKYTVAEYFILN